MIYRCDSENRRQLVRKAAAVLNGLDYVEVATGSGDLPQRTLVVRFVNDLAAPPPTPAQWRIEGGQRIRGLKVLTVEPTVEPDSVRLVVDRAGDLSTYTLRLVADKAGPFVDPPAGYDPILSAVDFSFRPGCGDDLDCRPPPPGGTAPDPPPPLDYTAKDYLSFRRVLLDGMALLQPGWTDREVADVRMVLVEALAYAADRLSYIQDAVATEAYIGTARKRVSVRRHARLVDYPMHDGAAARAWVRVGVKGTVAGLPEGTRLMTGPRSEAPVVKPGEAEERALRAGGALVFEVLDSPAQLHEAHNVMRFHTWGGTACVLPRGCRRATLREAVPTLAANDVLVLAATKAGQDEPDPDLPGLRHAVRLTAVAVGTDPATGSGITEIGWSETDGLPFDLPVDEVASPETAGAGGSGTSPALAAAFGNVVLADHGETIRNSRGLPRDEPLPEVRVSDLGRSGRPSSYRPRLALSPVTQRGPYRRQPDKHGLLPPAVAATTWDMASVLPDVRVRHSGHEWPACRDLLTLGDEPGVVVEVDDEGVASLRFGDGTNGREPDATPANVADPVTSLPFSAVTVRYRMGGGLAGNVGPDTVTRLVLDGPVAGLAGSVSVVSNPLPAAGGADPEPIERVRQRAPYAYRTQLRCITPEDYARRAAEHDGVQRAAARLRWTGSWYTVFLFVDRVGGKPVDDEFEADLRSWLEPQRMMGHDLEVVDPVYVPLELTLEVCIRRGEDWPRIRARLGDLFSARVLPDGTRGVFHPDVLTFGAPIFTGPLIAAAQRVPGVAWADFSSLSRLGSGQPVTVENGRVVLDPPQIPRLDNDPNFPDNGAFHAVRASTIE